MKKERKVGRTAARELQEGAQAGAKMAFGTDAGVYPHGQTRSSSRTMVEWGMTPVQAIRSATSSAADLLAGRIASARADPAGSPISSRSPAIRSRTSRRCSTSPS